MKEIQYTTSPGIPPRTMEEEFLCHKRGPEWWYSTGYMHDENGELFSYQFTLAKIRVYGIRFNILITAITDFKTGKHYYAQESIFFEFYEASHAQTFSQEQMSAHVVSDFPNDYKYYD